MIDRAIIRCLRLFAVRAALYRVGVALGVVFGLALTIATFAIAQTVPLPTPSNKHMNSEHQETTDQASRECAVKLKDFILELDKLLASNPSYVYPVLDLLKKYFPMEKCNTEEDIRISRNSKFFSHVSETETYCVIAFDSKGYIS